MATQHHPSRYVDEIVGNELYNEVLSLSSVPETSTWAMMLLGFAGLGFAGYRSSRKSASTAA